VASTDHGKAFHLPKLFGREWPKGHGLFPSLLPWPCLGSPWRPILLFTMQRYLTKYGPINEASSLLNGLFPSFSGTNGVDTVGSIFWRVSDGDSSTPLYIRRWLSDTAVYQDAAEVVAEKSRRHWWGQQIDVAKISWALLLAIEGRRRGIPFLWAYLSLAHLVNLSFAQNLFYLAMLLTPAPIPKPNAPESAR